MHVRTATGLSESTPFSPRARLTVVRSCGVSQNTVTDLTYSIHLYATRLTHPHLCLVRKVSEHREVAAPPAARDHCSFTRTGHVPCAGSWPVARIRHRRKPRRRRCLLGSLPSGTYYALAVFRPPTQYDRRRRASAARLTRTRRCEASYAPYQRQ